MELPISSESYRPDEAMLWRQVDRARDILAKTFAESVEGPGVSLMISGLPWSGGLADFARMSTDQALAGSDGLGTLLDSIESRWQEHCTSSASSQGATGGGAVSACRAIYGLDPKSMDEGQLKQMADGGWVQRSTSLWLLRSWPGPAGEDPAIQVIPARAMIGKLEQVFAESVRRLVVAEGSAQDVRMIESAVRARTACLDESRFDLILLRRSGDIIASCGLVTLGQVGVLWEPDGATPNPGTPERRLLLDNMIERGEHAQFEHILIELPTGSTWEPVLTQTGFQRVDQRVVWVRY